MTDCIVVGGGLIGMLSARMLHDQGLDVTLLDRQEPGQEASWAGGGILSPLYPWRFPDPVTHLASLTQAAFPSFADELLQETGEDPQWTQNGLLVLDPGQWDVAQAWARRWPDVQLEALDQPAVHGCEPALAEGFDQGVWMPRVAQVRNPRLMRALQHSLVRRGVDIRPRTPVSGFRVRSGRVTGVITEQGELLAERVVVAGGAWTGGLLLSLGAPPIEPVRGQMILFRGPPGLLSRMVLNDDQYIIPRRDGHVLAGSSLEKVGFDKSITEAAAQTFREAAARLVPALADLPIEKHWAGLRPGSPQGIPYIGPHPEVEGLFVNAGHYRNGVVMSIGACRLLTDLIMGHAPICDPSPYRIDRADFSVRRSNAN